MVGLQADEKRLSFFTGTLRLTFFKLLGTGGKNGFSSLPNFGIYVLFCVWESEKNANFFLRKPRF
ncbi:MAG: hypothetical protein EA341_09170 [Mongoliibacter sp.]|nr:MAG: hypothetical protein EA341_09170 [Mongoliibacter sp.]